ncbi:prepilin-type N-terminal cleavage/methylation domain-containing protein [Candidatus Falkowbacteria bacterium]|nr:prepilin-type N-terminal cleavage/methylation domain-containing protein [Candidatus Falkowbacteria bacterium]
MQKNFSKGFTLIELLVVISIIGVLSSLAVVSLNNARTKARDALRKGDTAQLRTALNLYYDNNNRYPICDHWNEGRADFGATPDNNGAGCYNTQLSNDLTGGSRPYLASMPKDPRNPTNSPAVSASLLYRYVSNGDGSQYALVYQLEEQQIGVDQVMRGW